MLRDLLHGMRFADKITERGGPDGFAGAREVRAARMAYVGMSATYPLTVTVEQAAEILGVGRSTAYELVRSGDLECIRLRRRILVPVAHLAEALGVERAAIWTVLDQPAAPTACRPR